MLATFIHTVQDLKAVAEEQMAGSMSCAICVGCVVNKEIFSMEENLYLPMG